jgi:serine protease
MRSSNASALLVTHAMVVVMIMFMGPLPTMQARHVRTAAASPRMQDTHDDTANLEHQRTATEHKRNEIPLGPVLLSSFENYHAAEGRAVRRMDVVEAPTTMADARVKMPPASSASWSSSRPPIIKSRSELELGHLESQAAASTAASAAAAAVGPRRKRKVEVRNLEFRSCGGGDGTQFVVACTAGTEEHCYRELTDAGAVIVNRLVGEDYFVVCVDTPSELALLKSLTNVEDLEEDPIRSLSYLPELTRPVDRRELLSGQTVPDGVMMVRADAFWGQDRGGNSRVCIIDTGLYVGHEDMQGATHAGSDNGNQVVTPYSVDDSGHGTHVAGTVAAVDNDVGVVGVAPEADLFIVRGRNARLSNSGRPLGGGNLKLGDASGPPFSRDSHFFAIFHLTHAHKVFQGADSQFTGSSLAAAMEECRLGNANVISMSLGGASSSAFERNKVDSLASDGIMLVAASGNSGAGPNPMEYPAGYDNVISVGAVHSNRNVAGFSTHNDQVDVSALGVDVLSLTHECSNCYAMYSGTSMAAPHVAGVAALLMSKYGSTKSREEIRQAIEMSAQDIGACGPDRLYGHGVVDVMAAAAYLDAGASSPEQTSCISTKVTVLTDSFASESSYEIRDTATGATVYKNGPFENSQTTYTDEFFLPIGCYEFEMKDSHGTCLRLAPASRRLTLSESDCWILRLTTPSTVP